MKVNENCAQCLYKRQQKLTDNQAYLAEIRSIIDNRTEYDTSPYLVYLFNNIYEKYFGKRFSYAELKRKFNDLVLSMEPALRERITSAQDSLEKAFIFARVGNYIDFGAMNDVDEETFISLFDDAGLSENDLRTYDSFIRQCKDAGSFLLIADNCGEIVLDKLLLEELKKAFPQMKMTVMVRGGEVLNDASPEDAYYVGIDKVAAVIPNGLPISGTVPDKLSDEAKFAVRNADVILAKGQGNYESLSGQGIHVFYSFLCKCPLFTEKFNVPKLTGMFIEELG